MKKLVQTKKLNFKDSFVHTVSTQQKQFHQWNCKCGKEFISNISQLIDLMKGWIESI